ncbi:extracellular solute-binding protein [Magnetospirillum sp. ME-1]|uniref:extracellular solute-binding protein n=1 Tax=Magnetospirillum sp. ME-1 TaxID=1639348 RepID=UPI000A195E67|nr:extracellular solute-binding protein [Magnetospirillum sp. ME-1]
MHLLRIVTAIGLLFAPAAQAATKLQFVIPSAATGDSNRLFFELARNFQQSAPDVSVEVVTLSSYDEVVGRVKSDAAAKRSAGLFVAELSTTIELQQSGAILPMGPAMGAEFDAFKAGLLPSFLGNSSHGGVFLSAPYFRSMPVAYYNMESLASVGYGPDQLPNSWTEFEAMLEKLTAKSGRPSFALGGEWYDWLFEALAATTGDGLHGDIAGLGLNSSGSIEALTLLQRLHKKGLLVRSPGWKGTINAFSSGAFPVAFYSSGGAGLVEKAARFPWITTHIPRHSGKSVPVGGGNLFLSAHMSSEEQAAALRFIRYLYSPQAQAILSEQTGYFPVTQAAFNEPAMAGRYGQAGAYRRLYANLPNASAKLMTANNLKVRALTKAAIDRTLDEGMNPADSLARAYREVSTLMGH